MAGNTAFTDLRGWLERLEASGRLARARPGVPLRFTLAAIAKRLDGRKATYFPSPDGHALSVVSGIVSDRGWIAEAMGVEPGEVLARFQAAIAAPLPVEEVPSSRAPVQAVVSRDPDLLRELPIPVHNEHDAGAYVSAGLVIAANPATGVQNVSINRLQVTGPSRMGILILPRDLHRFHDAAEAAGNALPVAVAIGVDPLTLLASQAIVPIDFDELGVAGALHGRPLPVVKCLTNAVRVPAEAEIVIEGRVLPAVREPEGPFGEFPQYYGGAGRRQVIVVDAITRRRDALYHTIVPAAMEHLLLGAIPREASLLAHLKRSFPSVRDVHLPRGGVCRYHLVVKIAKRFEGEPKNIMMGAFAGHADLKQVVIVDEDVDIHDPVSVEWAVATRFQAAADLVVVAGAQGSRLDPSAEDGRADKMGLDATKPLGGDPFRFTVVHVPGEEDPAVEEWLAADRGGTVWHLTTGSELEAGTRDGRYRPARFAEDGFVHCCGDDRALVLAVARGYYRGVPGPVLAVAIDIARLSARVEWEAPSPPPGGGGHRMHALRFPHVYGPIERSAMTEVLELVATADGFSWPAGDGDVPAAPGDLPGR